MPNYDQIALEAVKQNWYALDDVPIDISNYDQIVLEAVKQNGKALRYVPENISNYENLKQIAEQNIKMLNKDTYKNQNNLVFLNKKHK